MENTINTLMPVQGSGATTSSIRSNFAAAKTAFDAMPQFSGAGTYIVVPTNTALNFWHPTFGTLMYFSSNYIYFYGTQNNFNGYVNASYGGSLYGSWQINTWSGVSFSGGGTLGGTFNLVTGSKITGGGSLDLTGSIYFSSVNAYGYASFSGGGTLYGSWNIYGQSGYMSGYWNMQCSGPFYWTGSDTYQVQLAGQPMWFSGFSECSFIASYSGGGWRVHNNLGALTTAVINVAPDQVPHFAYGASKPGGGGFDDVSSDARTKRDVEPYTAGLREIEQLQPIRYGFNGRADTPTYGTYHGFRAEDVREVMPEMVRTRRVKLDPDDDEDSDILTINSSPLLYAIVNAIKELHEEIKEIKARLP